MADLFPALALGDCLDEAQCIVITAKVATNVTKGQMVVFNTHTASEIPSVSIAGVAAANCLGMAMQTKAAGEYALILIAGVAKVTSGAGVTGGVVVVTGATGTIETVGTNTFEKAVGRALQTFAAGDTGLAYINCLP